MDDLDFKGQEKATGAPDPKLIIRDTNGTPKGVATSARAVPQLQKDIRTSERAIEQLQIARDYVRDSKLPLKSDPRFHNAVLSVAATTNANASDATTKHEEGTLTGVFGRPDVDAIERKIEASLKNNLNGFYNQLDPLPDGFDEKPKAKGDAAPKAASAGAKGAPSATNDKGETIYYRNGKWGP